MDPDQAYRKSVSKFWIQEYYKKTFTNAYGFHGLDHIRNLNTPLWKDYAQVYASR